MFAYALEFLIVLIGLVLLALAFRWMIRSPAFTAWVNGTVDTSSADAEAALNVAEDKVSREISTSEIIARARFSDAERLTKRVKRTK